jgi:hypothetical protein
MFLIISPLSIVVLFCTVYVISSSIFASEFPHTVIDHLHSRRVEEQSRSMLLAVFEISFVDQIMSFEEIFSLS